MSREENLRIMRNWIEAANEHNVNRSVELMDGGVTAESDTLPAPVANREAYRKSLRAYFSAFPDIHYDIEQLIVDDHHAAVRMRCRGTHQGEFRGIAATGRQFEIRISHFAQIRNGKIIHTWSYWDTGTLLRQLGL